MSSNNVAHVSSVDKGLKMKIKRTKGPNKVDPKHEVVKSGEQAAQQNNTTSTSGSTTPGAITNSNSLSNTSTHTPNSVSVSSSPATFQQTSAPLASKSTVISSTADNLSTPNKQITVTTGDIHGAGDSSHWVGPLTKSPLKSWNTGPGGANLSTDPSIIKDSKSPKSKSTHNKKTVDGKSKPPQYTAAGQVNQPAGGFPSHTSSDFKRNAALSGLTSTSSSTSLSSTGSSGNGPVFSNNLRGVNSGLSSEPRPGDIVHVKRENPVHDPYEFNAKVEDKIELPPKKLKIEKPDYIETATSPQSSHHLHHQQQTMQQSSVTAAQQVPPSHHHTLPNSQQQQQQQASSPGKRSVSVETCSAGTVTEPDCLGPCEPGTSVRLEGIVWKETDNGLLVVNVTWRGKTYMGTLMDSTRYAWAPPRPGGCESPVSDFESRQPKGRGKRTSRNSTAAATDRLTEGRRLRKGRRGTVNSSSSNFTAPPSPAKSEVAGSGKRKASRTENDVGVADKSGKRSRSCSRGGGSESPNITEKLQQQPPSEKQVSSDAYIVCPEPNCHKKYKHMNGLRYHRTHAHRKSSVTEDGKEDAECDEEYDEDKTEKKDKTPLSERAERMKAKEKQRSKGEKRVTDRDSKDSIDDDIPLKDLVTKVASKSSDSASADGKDRIDSIDALALVGSNIDPQVVLTKTTMHLSIDTNSSIEKSKDSMHMSSNSLLTLTSPSSLPTSSALNPSVPFNPLDNSSSIPLALSNNGSTGVPVMTTLKSPITSQVYQISTTGCPGGVTLVTSQTNPSLSLVSAQTFPLNSSASQSPLSSTTTTPSVRTSVSNVRPIAPSPHSGSYNSPGSSLKTIQPKPQTGTDYSSNVQGQLSDTNKDKMRKSKKKRTENKDSPSSSVASPSKPLEPTNSENDRNTPSHLVKNVGNMSFGSNPDPLISNNEDLRPCLNSSPNPELLHLSGGAGVGQRPSYLPITPNNGEVRSTINDDVHSPAYSDISDANDGGSPTHPGESSPGKKDVTNQSLASIKKEPHPNGSPHRGPDGISGAPSSSLPGHYPGMYYFGGPPPGFLPHGIGPQSLASPTIKKEQSGEDRHQESKDGSLLQQQQRLANSPQSLPAGANGASVEMQQKNFLNYYAHMQYPYNMAGFPPAPHTSASIDQQLHQALASTQDPVMRQHIIDQHQHQLRILQQHHDAALMSAGAVPTSTAPDVSGKRTPSGVTVSGPNRHPSGSIDANKRMSMVEMRDQALREKKHENHQILKENIDLKSHMGQQQQMNYRMHKNQLPNEMQRDQVYNQLKNKDSPRSEKKKSEMATSHNQGGDSIKKEPRPDSRLDDSKRLDIKDELSRPSSQSGLPPTSLPSLPAHPSSFVSTPSPSPASMVPPIPGAPQPPGFPFSSYYPPPPGAFRPMHLDPGHPMYRTLNPHIMGFASAPPHPATAFLHPTQLGYRLPSELDGKSSTRLDADGKPVATPPGANVRPSTPLHKIHELQEKARLSSPGVKSPAPSGKSSDGLGKSGSDSGQTSSHSQVDKGSSNSSNNNNTLKDSSSGKEKPREYTSSPPTQRHVHTHHHTHVVGGFPPLYPPDAYSGKPSHTFFPY